MKPNFLDVWTGKSCGYQGNFSPFFRDPEEDEILTGTLHTRRGWSNLAGKANAVTSWRTRRFLLFPSCPFYYQETVLLWRKEHWVWWSAGKDGFFA